MQRGKPVPIETVYKRKKQAENASYLPPPPPKKKKKKKLWDFVLGDCVVAGYLPSSTYNDGEGSAAAV